MTSNTMQVAWSIQWPADAPQFNVACAGKL